MSAITVKVEPPDVPDSSVGPLNLSTVSNGEDLSINSGTNDKPDYKDSSNFTCLLCDVVCESRDALRKHLKDLHASKHYSVSNVYNPVADMNGQSPGYLNYRYTCTICRAKFKSFRTYLSHTMSHRGVSAMTSHFDDPRMAALFGAGKQCMQDYFESEEVYGGNFTCPECKTDFLQRDSYAMHMMMRAMNETCKGSETSMSTNNNDDEKDKTSQQTHVISVDEESSAENNVSDASSQRCLEDVTSKVDQDEYLKSVLDKVCSVETSHMKPERPAYKSRSDEKLCSFCGSSYPDQDSLAMHVMSDHAEEMTLPGSSRSNAIEKLRTDVQQQSNQSYLSWMAAAAAAQPLAALSYVCKYCNSSFMSRNSLAMHVLTHAHIEEKLAEIARYPKKRKFETLNHDVNTKTLKRDEHVTNGFSHEHQDTTRGLDLSRLYCDKCDIKFYALSEYNWHMKRHEETFSVDYETHIEENKTDSNDLLKPKVPTEFEKAVINNNRGRRNSTSSCYIGTDSALNQTLPRRPVSVGVCNDSNSITARDNVQVDNRNGQQTERSPPSLETVLSNVHALSSNEQRIIYSVFGKDLSLKVNKNTEQGEKHKDNPRSQHGQTSAPCDLPKPSVETNYNEQVDCKDEIKTKVLPSMLPPSENADDRKYSSSAAKDAPMCKYCEIVFYNKAIYYLHMGLHNVNNPWQCNVCGKICNDAVDFAAHVIHM